MPPEATRTAAKPTEEEALPEKAGADSAGICVRCAMRGARSRSGTMGRASSAAIAAGWSISPLRIDADTGALIGAVLFDPVSQTVLMVDGDADGTCGMEDGERGE